MSIPVRHSGRIALAALIVITLIAALLGVRLFALAVAPPPATIEIDRPPPPTFTIGPIEGLTTIWHRVPPATSIPLGIIAQLFHAAPPDATVIWTGADEVARDLQGSTAVCPLLQPGITMVQVEVIPADGGDVFSNESSFNVVDIDVEQIRVSAIDMWVYAVEIDEGLPQDEINEQTMSYFFGAESIAALRDVGHGQYRTSVDRRVYMSVEVDPPGFAPLIEWRFGPETTMLGTAAMRRPREIGRDLIEVGPLLNPAQAEIETYSVTITSHTSGQDSVPEGEPVVFIAATDPPGYENEITWLSSTKYGTAEPILGEGPIFIAEFNDTWGIDENGDPFQWLGVKADNALFNQDGKCICPEDILSSCPIGALPPAGLSDHELMIDYLDSGTYAYMCADMCPGPETLDDALALFENDGIVETASPGWLKAIGKGLIGGGLVGLGGAIGSAIPVVGTGFGLAVGGGVAAGVIAGLNSGCDSTNSGIDPRVFDVFLYETIVVDGLDVTADVVAEALCVEPEETLALSEWPNNAVVHFMGSQHPCVTVTVEDPAGDVVPELSAEAFVLSWTDGEGAHDVFGVVVLGEPVMTGRPMALEDELIIEIPGVFDQFPNGTRAVFQATVLVAPAFPPAP